MDTERFQVWFTQWESVGKVFIQKSVSRSPSPSPSPSLRTDIAIDALDNEKGGGDTASISSSELAVTVVSAAPHKTDNPRLSTNTNKASDGGTRTKKKSWYNALYPTYKSKSEDFKRLFKDLPDDERLIVDYSSALQKDILAHGRLYASQNYLCFHASIFGWETYLTLRWKDVTAITKEKTALVIPNAILVCTETEKHFLTSFSGRDKAYLMLFRIWQNALMDQPMSSHEIWQWVHTCYGDELGFNSDDEGYCREPPDDAPSLPHDTVSEELVDAVVVDAAGDDRTSRTTPASVPANANTRNTHRVNGDGEFREEEGGDTLPTDMSDTSDSEPDKPQHVGEVEKCTLPHDGKLLLRQEFPFNVDQLFTMIFTNSKFNLELLAARGTTDYVQSPWHAQGGVKCRQVSYTLGLTSGPIGPKEVQVTETQVMNKCSKPGQLYSIDSTGENANIPYADYFTVQVHYCLRRVSENCTELSFYAGIKYKKSMWPMIKAFLEKNTMTGLEEFCRLLEAKLGTEADCAVPTARKTKRHRRITTSSPESSAPKLPPATVIPPRVSIPRPSVPSPPPSNTWVGVLLVVLLVLNAVLYWRLYYVETRQTFDLDDLQNRMSSVSGSQMAEWSRLLAQHTHRQRGEMLAWRDALDKTREHLAQTEQALTKLLQTIKTSIVKRDEPHEEL